ncbi:MAG: hypothetical protein ACREQ5_37190 [Candidatus Dormibacteria bacterium]
MRSWEAAKADVEAVTCSPRVVTCGYPDDAGFAKGQGCAEERPPAARCWLLSQLQLRIDEIGLVRTGPLQLVGHSTCVPLGFSEGGHVHAPVRLQLVELDLSLVHHHGLPELRVELDTPG